MFKQWLAFLALALMATVGQAQTPDPVSAPSFKETLSFEQLGHKENLKLLGIRNTEQIEFMLRRDQIVTGAALNLIYTPSPALLSTLSHLRVLLNDELMQVLPVTAGQSGQSVRQRVPLNAGYIADFNRIKLEFVGHYTDICEEPTHSSLWLDVDRHSTIELDKQVLTLRNDLSHFPQPFFDDRDNGPLVLPIRFASRPTLKMQRAAAILASYFGSQSKWRGARFPVSFEDPLPERHAILYATNDHRPAFLRDYPKVQAPVVEMISHPQTPYVKLLLVLGRDEDDLVTAATALALGSPLFRGHSVTIDKVRELQPRQPYDAPLWHHPDNAVRFDELLDFPDQLQVSGLRPRPIILNVNLPPDLFIWRNQVIPMQLKYRYTSPPVIDESRLHVSINSQFIQSFSLSSSGREGGFLTLRLPLLSDGLFGTGERLLIPALKIGSHNIMRFDFSFASRIGSAQRQTCQTTLPADVRAAIDGDSTLNFSDYYHYVPLPDLRIFANTGFPFSRMADLSETLVYVPDQSTPGQVGTLLDLVGNIGAATGYPGFAVTISSDWQQVATANADLLVIGPMPTGLRDRPDTHVLLDSAQSWLKQPRGVTLRPKHLLSGDEPAAIPATEVQVTAEAPIAAFVGMQSPFHPQRSVVGLLASTPEDYQLLRTALSDVGQRAAISGTVAMVRDSGVASEQVGSVYYVGNLPWWLLLWYHLADRPLLLAMVAVFTVVLFAFLLWYALRLIAHHRLHQNEEMPA